ncbi:hypothetical protein I5M27_01660 [Adhaeribacter sp. BT258]|uniref:Uncharacterized protein n=1 Tax=Adhaeribacter terrigena TaxID=2793070 RepID=A0ABS1BX10_9BACT|nr:hypothetical protein [Adhaeribacter terrigena]MBK0401671.1 hypothetical protein [Adhaeribacter terrigena]
MENLRQFSGENEAEIWQQIATDMQQQGEILTYSAQVKQQNYEVYFDIDIDLGGGFEGGFETTTFMAPVENSALKFHLHPQNWLNEVGKMLGMEDVELGYPRLDQAFMIKANNPAALKTIFTDESIRQTLLKYPDCELKLSHETDEPGARNLLTFSLDLAITNPEDLREIYSLMLQLLKKLEEPNYTDFENL